MKTMTKRDYYFDWLCGIVWEHVPNIFEEETDEDCELVLLHQLYDMEFYSLIPNDENRVMDGLELRNTYFEGEKGGFQAPLDGPCTVLEMLIALSYRLEFETAQSRWEKSPKQWFWILIDNLGLDFRQCGGIETATYREKIVTNVTLFVERRYKSDGNGGLFPLKSGKIDQKRIEIWYQMSAYLIENYPI